MSISKCPKCSNTIFQIEYITPVGSRLDVLCVICHSCSTVVGTLNHLSILEKIDLLDKKITNHEENLKTINSNLGKVLNGMNIIASRIKSK